MSITRRLFLKNGALAVVATTMTEVSMCRSSQVIVTSPGRSANHATPKAPRLTSRKKRTTRIISVSASR